MKVCTVIDLKLNCGQLIGISVISENNGIIVRQTVHMWASYMPTHNAHINDRYLGYNTDC